MVRVSNVVDLEASVVRDPVAARVLSRSSARRRSSPQARGFIFTVNNYTEADEVWLASYAEGIDCYMQYGHELAPTTGTPHLQGFIYFAKKKSRDSLRSLWSSKLSVHPFFEVMNGSVEQNMKYTGKDGDVRRFGEPPIGPGKMEKLRWENARIAAKAGRFDDIPADIYIRCRSSLHAIYLFEMETRLLDDNDVLDNYWYYGESGVGKSKGSRDDFPTAYLKSKSKWWGGYVDEDVVIIDDVDPSHQSWIGAFLKEWSDHYRFRADQKFGGRVIRPKTIVVTSQYPIEGIFNDPNTVQALRRRFKVFKFSPPLIPFSEGGVVNKALVNAPVNQVPLVMYRNNHELHRENYDMFVAEEF